jgi:hypothetical protein
MQSISKCLTCGEFPQDICQSLCKTTTTIQTGVGAAERRPRLESETDDDTEPPQAVFHSHCLSSSLVSEMDY